MLQHKAKSTISLLFLYRSDKSHVTKKEMKKRQVITLETSAH